jgi:hypothetical protein
LRIAAAGFALACITASSAAAQGPDTTVGIASLIGGGFQTTTMSYQNPEDCGGGTDTFEGDEVTFFPTGSPPSVAVIATRGDVRVSPIASIPVRVTVDRSGVYYGPERISSSCDSPTATEDCGVRPASADLMLTPFSGGVELRGGPQPRSDPFKTCYRPPATVDYPDIVRARSAPIPPAELSLGPFDVTLALRGGPVAFPVPSGSGSTTSQYTFRLIGAVAPLLSLTGPGESRTVRSRAGVAPVPVECSGAAKCRVILTLRRVGAGGSRAGAARTPVRAAAASAFPKPAPARRRADVARTRLVLRRGARRTARFRVGSRRGRFQLVVTQPAGGRRITYATGRVRVR